MQLLLLPLHRVFLSETRQVTYSGLPEEYTHFTNAHFLYFLVRSSCTLPSNRLVLPNILKQPAGRDPIHMSNPSILVLWNTILDITNIQLSYDCLHCSPFLRVRPLTERKNIISDSCILLKFFPGTQGLEPYAYNNTDTAIAL